MSEMNEKNILIIKTVLIMLLVFVIILAFGFYKIVVTDNQMDIQSKCYTNLESSNYLSATPTSAITENHNGGYIKIFIIDREFFYMQTAGTGSMRPFLQKRASVIFIKPNIEDIKVGDVITFECDDKNIVHRVIKIEDGIYTTKGDNNNIEDSKCIIKFEDIMGRVVGVLY